jgi:hypothetical protein
LIIFGWETVNHWEYCFKPRIVLLTNSTVYVKS